jgi:hypothetical protein
MSDFRMTKLIGIAGPARVGKDTVAQYVCSNMMYLHYWFAKPLKESARHMFGLSDAQLYGDLKEVKDKRWKKSPRKILQLLGTEVARDMFHKNLWIMRAEQAFIHCNRRGMVISDVRYENEAAWIRKMGGVIVHVKRPNAPKVRKHVSEAGIKLRSNDIVLNNVGTIQQLQKEIGIWIFGNSYIGGLPRDPRPTRD